MASLELVREPDWEARSLRMYGANPASEGLEILTEGRVIQVALTGGIGSGKSQVAALLKQAGAKVCSADEFARQALEEQTERIADAFGHPEWKESGVNRAELAQIVFADSAARRQLESLTHPRIAHLADTFFTSLRPGEVGIYEIPLLAEAERDYLFDAVITVTAAVSVRIDRLVNQRGFTREQAVARINNQANDEQRRALSNWMLHNDGSVAQLRQVVLGELWPTLVEAANPLE